MRAIQAKQNGIFADSLDPRRQTMLSRSDNLNEDLAFNHGNLLVYNDRDKVVVDFGAQER